MARESNKRLNAERIVTYISLALISLTLAFKHVVIAWAHIRVACQVSGQWLSRKGNIFSGFIRNDLPAKVSGPCRGDKPMVLQWTHSFELPPLPAVSWPFITGLPHGIKSCIDANGAFVRLNDMPRPVAAKNLYRNLDTKEPRSTPKDIPVLSTWAVSRLLRYWWA